ncbi:MAG TPA: glycosyltransferase, partial [Gemmatimonadaceae bacterium]|nr:glycosyltransferase [Gemmatimonadaceae bacterium]
VCSSACITLGINPARAAGATTYVSDRLWMVMLAGGFFLGARTPGLDRILRDGEHCAFYDDAGSCAALARYYLEHPAERERIRKAGERYVRANHTYDQRVPHLLSGQPYIPPA